MLYKKLIIEKYRPELADKMKDPLWINELNKWRKENV